VFCVLCMLLWLQPQTLRVLCMLLWLQPETLRVLCMLQVAHSFKKGASLLFMLTSSLKTFPATHGASYKSDDHCSQDPENVSSYKSDDLCSQDPETV